MNESKAEILRSMVAPFFAQDGTRPLFVSMCCGRLYVGWDAPTKCRTCPTIPSPIKMESLADVEPTAAKLLS